MNKSLIEVATVGNTVTPSQMLMDNYLNKHSQYSEFAQSRTNFQIEKFIALADNTPVNCYVNTLHQTRVMNGELLREVKEATELMREFKYKYPDGENTDLTKPVMWPNNDGVNKMCWYDLDKISHDHRVMELSINIKDKLLQLEYFYAIMDRMIELHGKEFTKLEYENEAPEYWNTRLQKQVMENLMMSKFGIDSGNSSAILHSASEPILPNSANTAIPFPNIFQALAEGNVTEVLNLLQVNVATEITKINGTSENLLGNSPSFESLGVVV